MSSTRLRKPASSAASSVRWLRSTAPVGAAIVDQVGLEPEDRLDPVLAAGLVVLDRAVHDAVVGEPERRHAELRRALGHRLDLAGAVEQRVLAVDVQVDCRGAHRAIIATGPDATARVGEGKRATCDDPAGDLAAATRRRRGRGRQTTPRAGSPRRGSRQARAAGAALAALGVELEACLTSPKVRATQTAELAAEPLAVAVEDSEALRGGDFDLATLAAGRGELLLVGHEPDFSRAIQLATGARIEAQEGRSRGAGRSDAEAADEACRDPAARGRLASNPATCRRHSSLVSGTYFR